MYPGETNMWFSTVQVGAEWRFAALVWLNLWVPHTMEMVRKPCSGAESSLEKGLDAVAAVTPAAALLLLTWLTHTEWFFAAAEGGDGTAVAVPEDQLPLTLPETDNFKPSGSPESPLAAIDSWVNTTDPSTGTLQVWGSGFWLMVISGICTVLAGAVLATLRVF